MASVRFDLIRKAELMQSKSQNYRVVVMGHSGVGKSSIISQFMHRKFTESHKETIEELHRHLVKFESMSVEIDILDTSGSHQFPAMHKLAIATGDAFLLVYSLDKPESFDTVKLLRDEIKELKPKDQFSIVIVANKSDLEKTGSMALAVHESIVCLDWEEKFVSVSAKDGGNVNIVFQVLEEKIRERLQLNDKRHGFLRRISMPIMRLAKNERPQGTVLKTKTRTRSVES